MAAGSSREQSSPGRHSLKNPRPSAEYRITPLAGRVAVLASGGLDSSSLLAELAREGRQVFPIYVRAGHGWERDELAVLQRFIGALGQKAIRPVTIIRLPMDDVAGDHWSVTGRGIPGFRAPLSSNYIPGRNLMLLSKAAIFCARNRIGEIAMAALKANPFPDANPRFFRAFSRAVRLGIGLEFRVVTPYSSLTKADVIARSRDLPLHLTVSCIRPRGLRHCGACTKCAERIRAFRAAEIPDPTIYLKPPRRRGTPP
jgi:7-cyano-7-deazaguanine synthase